MKSRLLIILLSMVSLQSYGFDLEDYATTYRATRDAILKAGNELALAKDPYDLSTTPFLKLEAGCFRLKSLKHSMVNFEGLMSGACNKDGALPYKNGGPKLADDSEKLGDKIAVLINMLPFTASLPDFDTDLSRYQARREQLRTQRKAALLADLGDGAMGKLEAIPDCIPTDRAVYNQIQLAISKATTAGEADPIGSALSYMSRSDENGQLIAPMEDWATTHRATRDAFLKSANELELAIGPYKSARAAYEAANVVFTSMLGCEGTMAREGVQYYDPYEW